MALAFEKSTSSTDTDELNKAMNNLFSNAGINKLIVSSGDSSNANGIRYSIANDFGKISIYLRRIESWLNYWIKHNIADGFYLEIFDQSQYNREDFINEKKDAASLGAAKMDYLCSLGNDPYVAYNKIRFESNGSSGKVCMLYDGNNSIMEIDFNNKTNLIRFIRITSQSIKSIHGVYQFMDVKNLVRIPKVKQALDNKNIDDVFEINVEG